MKRLLPLLLLAAVATAAGQTMYRSTMPDGRVVLGDRPMPGARKVEEIKVPAGNVSPSLAPADKDKPKPKPPGGSRSEALAAADAELRTERQSYDAAREAASQGKEPLEGERLGTAGKGGSRLSDGYWARQKALADAVSEAEARVRAAQERINALR